MVLKKKVKIAGVIMLLTLAGVDVTNRINMIKEVAALNETIEAQASSIEILENKNRELELQIVEVKDSIKEWLPKTIEIPLKNKNNSFKSYMDYRKITDETSPQYKFIHSGKMKVEKDGLLKDKDGYIGVALGSYYQDKIGQRFIITLEGGKTVKIIVIDEKDDKDTIDGANHKTDNSMIEMVIDVSKAKKHYKTAILMGDFNYVDEFKGNIIKIERVVE